MTAASPSSGRGRLGRRSTRSGPKVTISVSRPSAITGPASSRSPRSGIGQVWRACQPPASTSEGPTTTLTATPPARAGPSPPPPSVTMTTSRRTPRATNSADASARRHGASARVVAAAAVVALMALVAGCSTPTSSSSTTTSTTLDDSGTTTTTEPAAESVVFTASEGNIDAYLPTDPFTRQRVVAAGTGPVGTVPHGQICFDANGSRRFVVAETRTPVSGTPAVAS